MNQRGYTDKEYKKIKQTIQQGDLSIINDELVERIARYKFYYCLWNADKRVSVREDYRDIKYCLGVYTQGFDYMKEHKKELYGKLLAITKIYLIKGMDMIFAPQIHREREHYSWEDIDILPAKEHMKIDTKKSKETIVRWHFTFEKSTTKTDSKPLTIEIIKKVAEGKRFPSITQANEYIHNECGIKPSKINKLIDTAETIVTEKGNFDIFKAENKEQVTQIKLSQFHEMFNKQYPQLDGTFKRFKALVSKPEGKKSFKLWLKKSKVKHKGYKLKKDGYVGLKILNDEQMEKYRLS
ncbi:UNVERIFIED_ORG: hypothetical protein ABIC97_003644 [Peribacillus simplex]